MWIYMDGLKKEHSGLYFGIKGGEHHEEVLSTEDSTLCGRLLYKALGMALKCPLPSYPSIVGIRHCCELKSKPPFLLRKGGMS